MKLITRITLRLSIVLLPIMLIWGTVFYISMVNEINDETDDSLEDYAEQLIRRTLAGKGLPQPGSNSNNVSSIEPLPDSAHYETTVSFCDRRIYIYEKEETEPAREMTMIFTDKENRAYKLVVSTPTFEREDLLRAVFIHIVILYMLLMITILVATTLIFHYSMRPLYALLRWLDNYRPGSGTKDLPMEKNIVEFKKLTEAARHTIERAESYMERQKQFIGNASHELQTPLAILGTRIEWMIDNTELTEEQFAELSKMRQSLQRMSRLNRTLLLLSKIDNNQFPDRSDIDLVEIINNEIGIYSEIYGDSGIRCNTEMPQHFVVNMNESLATTMITNLIKNAFLHTGEDGTVDISIRKRQLIITNKGSEPLDSTRLFDRFYTSGKKGSTGLGLALVKSIANSYNFQIEYLFKDNRHCFIVKF